ncbi:transaminase [Derxia gummosa]|uniref:Transaminase n=1 Tax=Derxia gummosa DSM 723 TaxID=1121388 RepID=A0A8B6XAW4_9BURK|nr:transaminase [Derxia gummosa]
MNAAAFLLPPARLAALHAAELARHGERFAASVAACRANAAHYLLGAPLHWMADWPAPLAVERAEGARLVTVDGVELIDFCLGDTAAMFGHSPPALVAALAREAERGLSAMLPGAEAAATGAALEAAFGMPVWQFAATASDANRFLLRWARAVTGRQAIVVMDGCYHGTVDETLVDMADDASPATQPGGGATAAPPPGLGADGRPRAVRRPSILGPAWDASATTRVVPFNDLAALDAALADGQVAALLAEPALTNCGLVLPEPGYWREAAALARRHGTLLLIDETHTLSAGPGGWARSAPARAEGVAPDAVVIGKAIAGGMPCAVTGVTAELAARMTAAKRAAPPGHSGIGTTLAGSRLAVALVGSMLREVMTPAAWEAMDARAAEATAGIAAAIARHRLPWCVSRLGARLEFQFRPEPPRDAAGARAAMDDALEAFVHLALLNRGIVITPFHNMLLCSPATSAADVAALVAAFDEVCALIAGAADGGAQALAGAAGAGDGVSPGAVGVRA